MNRPRATATCNYGWDSLQKSYRVNFHWKGEAICW